MSTIDTTTINQSIIETHRLIKQPLCLHQDDAIRSYDKIIRPHAILHSRKFGILENVCHFISKHTMV